MNMFVMKHEEPSTMGEKECYFFCQRGRKYRNSIRPNRVTGSGFWKATGIDKSVYCVKESHECIGLKKSLVYYRGSAGKGTKTDWMMHEFRLPPAKGKSGNNSVVNHHGNDVLEAVSHDFFLAFLFLFPLYATKSTLFDLASLLVFVEKTNKSVFVSNDVLYDVCFYCRKCGHYAEYSNESHHSKNTYQI